MKDDLLRRAKNLAVFTVFQMVPIMAIFYFFGLLAAPVSEYVFWYSIGAVIGLPLFMGIDWLKRRNAKKG